MACASPTLALCAILLAAVPVGAAARAQAPPASAPPAPPLSLSVGDAMIRAVRGSEDVEIARAAVTRAGADVARVRSQRWPQLGVSASYDRTLASEFESLLAADPVGGADPGAFADLPFGRKDAWRLDASLSQLLLGAGRVGAQLDAARAGRAHARLGLESARAAAALAAAEAYFDAVLGDGLLAAAEASLAQAEDTVVQVALLFREGQRPEYDLLRARTAVASARVAVARRAAERDLARLRLAQLLDLPPDRPLALTTRLAADDAEPAAELARRAAGLPPAGARTRERTVVRAAREATRARRAAVAAARAERRPSLYLTSRYGRVAYELDPSVGDLRTNWTVGVAVDWPIFTGGRLDAEVRGARAELDEARARLAQIGELAALDARAAERQLASARAAWISARAAVGLAVRTYEIAALRYRDGLSTQLELADARLLLAEARIDEARAGRDLQVARIRLALLPALPLAVFAPGADVAGAGAARAAGTGGGALDRAGVSAGAASPDGGGARGARGGAAPAAGGGWPP